MDVVYILQYLITEFWMLKCIVSDIGVFQFYHFYLQLCLLLHFLTFLGKFRAKGYLPKTFLHSLRHKRQKKKPSLTKK